MRQRLDDPVFQFSNSSVSGNSTLTSHTTVSSVAAYVSLAQTVTAMAAQLSLIGLIKSS
jgi:hypothetical protein